MAVTLGYGGLQSVPDKQDTARIIFKQPPKKSSGSKKGGSGGSSGGSSTRQSTIAGVQAEAQRIAAQAEAAKQAEIQKQIAAEKARIQAEINKLNLVRAYKSRDVKSGVTSDVKEYKNGSKIIREFTERDTGITRYERYGAGRGGGSRQFQESFSFQDRFTAEQNKNIRDELNLAGLVPLSTNGQVTGFLSKITGKRYDYSDKGIEKFNKDLAVKGMIQDVKNKVITVNGVKTKIPILQDSNSQKLLVNYNFKDIKSSIKTTSQILKAVVVSGRSIPRVLADYGISLGKGFTKIGLYAIDEAGYITQIRYNKQTGKLIIPRGTKALTDKLGTVKKWADYEFKTNPLRDPDLQNVTISTALVGIGLASPGLAVKIFGAVKGKAIYDAIKNPTEYNIAVVESLFLPGIIKRVKKAVARRDILVANTGELVPLKERIKQVDFVTKNAGKTIETISARVSKPSIKSRFTNVLNKKSPDYTYGKRIEFGTYKVGKAYPTSKYFLEKGSKIQKLLRQSRISIERVYVSLINKKYGKYIKSILLKKGRVPESFIKKYYSELQIEANHLGRPVVGISPKRLRGFPQAEQEIIKVLPSKYIPKKLKFAGFTEEGYRVFSDEGRIKSLKQFFKSKITKGKIERSYLKELAREKLQYLKGRKAIKGEYAEHGRGHLTARNIDPYAQRYARNLNIKKFGNVFKQHDLAKVSDVESFSKFEHGKVLYNLWKKGQYPDKNIYKLPKKLQRQIAESYAGHTPSRTRIMDIFKKRTKGGIQENSVMQDLYWYLKQKFNPYLQDVLTLDRIELPRAGRWNIRVKYNLLSPNSLKRIYGSELNAIKNIRFLDWKTVPKRLIKQLGKKNFNVIKLRDSNIIKILKRMANKTRGQNFGWGSTRKIKTYKPSKISSIKKIPYQTSNYKKIKGSSYKMAYKKGYESGYKVGYNKPINYKTNYGKYQRAYSLGYKDSYKGKYKITPIKYTPYKGKYTRTPIKYTPYKGKYTRTPPSDPPPITPPPTIRINLPKFKSQSLSRPIPTYYVVEKVRGKFKKLYPKPLSVKDAKDYAVYSIDNRLSKTAFFVPMGKSKNVVRPPKQIQNYYSRNSRKVRPYRIRFGKKRQLVNGFIEKRKFFQDTIGEKRQLRSLRRRPKRIINSNQRRELLRRLKIARAVRMRNLRRRKR